MVAPVLTKVCRGVALLSRLPTTVLLPNTILLVPRIHGAESTPDAEREWSARRSYHGFVRGALVQAYRSGIGPPPPARGGAMVRIRKPGDGHIRQLDTEGPGLGSKASGGWAGTPAACCSCEKRCTPCWSCPEGLQGRCKAPSPGNRAKWQAAGYNTLVDSPAGQQSNCAVALKFWLRGVEALVEGCANPKSLALRAQRRVARNPGATGKAAYRIRLLSFTSREKPRRARWRPHCYQTSGQSKAHYESCGCAG